MDSASIAQWVLYIVIAFFGVLGLFFGVELLYRLWHQVVLREITVGGMEFSEVANETLDRKGLPPVTPGTWLKRADYETVARELKRRYAEHTAIELTARRLTGAERERIIRLQIEGCLADLAGEGGDRARLTLDEGSLRIEAERPVEHYGFEVTFSARAWHESERLAPEGDAPIPVHGKIEFDGALRIRRGPDGKAALAPYRALVPPEGWSDGAKRALGELRVTRAGETE